MVGPASHPRGAWGRGLTVTKQFFKGEEDKRIFQRFAGWYGIRSSKIMEGEGGVTRKLKAAKEENTFLDVTCAPEGLHAGRTTKRKGWCVKQKSAIYEWGRETSRKLSQDNEKGKPGNNILASQNSGGRAHLWTDGG